MLVFKVLESWLRDDVNLLEVMPLESTLFYKGFLMRVTASFKFYLSHTRLYRGCITSSEM